MTDEPKPVAYRYEFTSVALRETTARAELAAELAQAKAALAIFADDENWRLGRRLDPNGSRFDGIEIARAALAAKPEARYDLYQNIEQLTCVSTSQVTKPEETS